MNQISTFNNPLVVDMPLNKLTKPKPAQSAGAVEYISAEG